MNDLRILKTQRAELDAQIKDAEAAHFNNVLADMIHAADNAAIDLRELAAALTTEANLRDATKKRSHAGVKVAPKYRNIATGKTWSGRGKAPAWFSQEDIDTGLIQVLR